MPEHRKTIAVSGSPTADGIRPKVEKWLGSIKTLTRGHRDSTETSCGEQGTANSTASTVRALPEHRSTPAVENTETEDRAAMKIRDVGRQVMAGEMVLCDTTLHGHAEWREVVQTPHAVGRTLGTAFGLRCTDLHASAHEVPNQGLGRYGRGSVLR